MTDLRDLIKSNGHGDDGRKNFNAGGLLLRDQMPGYDFRALALEVYVITDRENSGGYPKRYIMPSMAGDPGAVCHSEKLFVYLKAVSDGALPWNGRLSRHAPKTKDSEAQEAECRRAPL